MLFLLLSSWLVLRLLPPIVCSSTLATFLNAWHTSARMHEARPRNCPFCIVTPDTLVHLIRCPHLARAAFDVSDVSNHLFPSLLAALLSFDSLDQRDKLKVCHALFVARFSFNQFKFRPPFATVRGV